jgi:ADP-heptose:LPS heptosyltransferase
MFERVALLKLCCPGDILFTTPAIRAVKMHYPDAKIFYLCGQYSRFVPEHNPHIEKTLIVPPPFEMAGKFRNARAFWKGITTLARGNFDLAISFHRSRAVAAMARLGRAGKVISFDTARPIVRHSVKFEPEKHEVLRYLDLISLIDAPQAGLELEYQTTDTEDEEAEKLLATNGVSNPFAVIAPGGGENPGTTMHIKRWPAQRFGAVASYLRQRGLQVITVGSKSESHLGEAVCADANLAGKTTFPILAAILKQSSLVIANDSGPLYLASAVGAKSVGIYGPSSPDLVGPFSKRHRTAINRLFCHPCYRPEKNVRGLVECPQGHWACMLTLQVEEVIRAADELLAAA